MTHPTTQSRGQRLVKILSPVSVPLRLKPQLRLLRSSSEAIEELS